MRDKLVSALRSVPFVWETNLFVFLGAFSANIGADESLENVTTMSVECWNIVLQTRSKSYVYNKYTYTCTKGFNHFVLLSVLCLIYVCVCARAKRIVSLEPNSSLKNW